MSDDRVLASLTISVLADGRIRHDGDSIILLAYGCREDHLPYVLAMCGVPGWAEWVQEDRARLFREEAEAREVSARARRRKQLGTKRNTK